jgi:hypothetical protein
MTTFTHITVVDQEPVRIIRAANNRPKGFLEVESARCKFIAHERDLTEAVAASMLKGKTRRAQRKFRALQKKMTNDNGAREVMKSR